MSEFPHMHIPLLQYAVQYTQHYCIVQYTIAQYASCAFVKSKAERRMMLKLRGGTAAFQIEMGRWHGLKREERVCKECDSGEVEDVCHWLLRSALHGSPSGNLFWKPWTMKGRRMETEQPLSYHMHSNNEFEFDLNLYIKLHAHNSLAV